MAIDNVPSCAQARLVPALQTAQSAPTEDLLVCMFPGNWANYKGSRAQLEAEGVIPGDTKWPDRGVKLRWENGNLRFTLKRTRPDGMKGPMRLWLAGDYWNLDIAVKNRDWRWHQQREIEVRAKALAEDIHRQSPAGQREWSTNWNRYYAATQDKSFQAFKSIFVPERKTPGRKPRSTETRVEGGAQ